MSASPLDILCKVAAAERASAPPEATPPPAPPPHNYAPHHPLPPMHPSPPRSSVPPPPPDRLQALHPNPNLVPLHLPLPTPAQPDPYLREPFRLSSSAPSHPGFLSNATLPLEPPHVPVGSYEPPKAYYIGDSPLSNPPTTAHTPPLSIPSGGGYTRHLLNPAPSPLARNLSAPSLTEAGLGPGPGLPHQTVLLDSDGGGYARVSRTASANIPVPSSVVTSGQGLSPPVYGSPPLAAGMARMRSGSFGASGMKSVAGRVASKSSGRRDSYTRFTSEEEAMLMEGVRVYGVGNWKKILNSYRFHWKRTAVDLKDKYRNMTRAKMRRMNASSQSDLSSVGSDEGVGSVGRRDVGQAVSPLQSGLLSKGVGLGISPVSTANNTPSGSIEERDKLVRR